MSSSPFRLVNAFPFEEAGSAYNFFSTLPDVSFQIDKDKDNNAVLNVFAYLDAEGVMQANIAYIRYLNDVEPIDSLTFQEGFDCYSTVKGSYEEVYLGTREHYLPKLSRKVLEDVASIFQKKTGRTARVNNSKIVVEGSNKEEDRELLDLIASTIQITR